MWRLVGMTILLSRVIMANLNDQNTYYLVETNEGKSPELGNSRITTQELETSESMTLRQNNDERLQPVTTDDYSKFGREPERPIIHVDLFDETTQHSQTPKSLAIFWLPWLKRQDNMINKENRSSPLHRDQRLFNLWRSKRNSDHNKESGIEKLPKPVRVRFNSWGGKRSSPENAEHSELTSFKRIKQFSVEDNNRSPFNSWGGKRNLFEFNQNREVPEKLRLLFKSNDRRVIRESPNEMNSNFDTFTSMDNRIQQSKRIEELLNNETDNKRGSLKFIKNGEMTTSGSTMDENLPRKSFEPWGGKRRGELILNNDEDARSASVSLIYRKFGGLVPRYK